MKKRHKQKLIVLSVLLFLALNAPILLLFNSEKSFMGLPTIYVYIFSLWLSSSVASFVIFKKYDE